MSNPYRSPERGRYQGQFRPEFSRLHEDPDLFWIAPFPVRYIVLVLGPQGSGKSTVMSYLADKKAFEVWTLSTYVREIAESRGMPLKQSYLQDIGDELRAEHADGGYLARVVLRRIHQRHVGRGGSASATSRIAVSGFKHPAELDPFLSLHKVRILLLDSHEATRRARERTIDVPPRIAPAGRGAEAEEDTDEEPERDRHGPRYDEFDNPDAVDPRHRLWWTAGYGQSLEDVIQLVNETARTIPARVARIENDRTRGELFAEVSVRVAAFDAEFRSAAQ